VDGTDGDVPEHGHRLFVVLGPEALLRLGLWGLPHGWGHARQGVRLRVAVEHAGTSLNDITDDHRVDELTGTAAFSGVPVAGARS
jgi:hypothetical protein